MTSFSSALPITLSPWLRAMLFTSSLLTLTYSSSRQAKPQMFCSKLSPISPMQHF
uniref:Uncharacterized protein n=1 Tax=Rhizophora mucronata TaxID=61149 RepID=A0A2P2P2R7_RHIMU